MFTLLKRLSLAAACTVALMLGAITSANAMLPIPPGGSGGGGSGTGGGTTRDVIDPVIVTSVPWHLVVPIAVVASVLLAVALAATFTAVHTRNAAWPHHA